MSTPPSRAEAEALDAADELASFRQRFLVDDNGPIYLDGNSLGRAPRSTAARLQRVVEDEWGRGLIGSWADWIERAGTVGDRLAEHVLGARPGEVTVGDSTSVNLYKLAVAALDARPDRRVIVTDAANFPSDRYIVEGLAAQRGLTVRHVADDPEADDVADAVAAGDVALVTLSHVSYRTGARLDLPAITEAAHRGGALMLWDLSHSAGAVPIGLDAHGVDLAVGCTYKYLNAGPGAPAFLYVRSALQAELRQPIWGWFGAADQFVMGPHYEAAAGIDRFQVGTPPILGLAAIDEGLHAFADAGIDRLRRKSLAVGDLVFALRDGWLAEHGVEVATPRAPSRRGSHVSLRHPDAWRICRALIEDAVIPDFREPDVIRFGIAPLYTRFVDVWDAVDRLRTVLVERRHEAYPEERSRIT